VTTASSLSEHSLGSLAQIPEGEGKLFECQGRVMAVFHLRSGAVRATQASCPHRGGPLADGIVGGTTLVCPLHGWKFDLDTGKSISGDCAITSYQARVTEDGDVLVVVDPAEEATAAVQAKSRGHWIDHSDPDDEPPNQVAP